MYKASLYYRPINNYYMLATSLWPSEIPVLVCSNMVIMKVDHLNKRKSRQKVEKCNENIIRFRRRVNDHVF